MPFLLALLGPLLGSIVNTVGSKLGVDMDSDAIKAKKLDIQMELSNIIAQGDYKQLEINLAEAANPSRKWPTWREMLGYVCVVAVAYHFVIQQFLAFILLSYGIPVELPVLEMSGLMAILSSMLGVHFVDSKYNSPLGSNPVPDKPPAQPSGHLVNDPEAGGLVWRS